MYSVYSVYSKFDIDKHKQTFINYLEVIISDTGCIEYAVPSHTYKLEDISARKIGVSVEELRDMCPESMYGDYIKWLCQVSGAIAVWNDFFLANTVNDAQLSTLRNLKDAGIYTGNLTPGIM